MTLDPQSKYPMNRSYVLKLHRDSHPLRETSPRWNPLTTSGATFYLHIAVAVMWMASLFLGFTPIP